MVAWNSHIIILVCEKYTLMAISDFESSKIIQFSVIHSPASANLPVASRQLPASSLYEFSVPTFRLSAKIVYFRPTLTN